MVELPAVDIVEEDAATDAVADVEPPKMMMASRPSFKWSTPTGARIGCHQNYPGDVKSMALEQVNLLPRRWLWRRRLASPQPQDQAVAQPPEWTAAGRSRAAARRGGERPAGAEQQHVHGAESGRREQQSGAENGRRGFAGPAQQRGARRSRSARPVA